MRRCTWSIGSYRQAAQFAFAVWAVGCVASKPPPASSTENKAAPPPVPAAVSEQERGCQRDCYERGKVCFDRCSQYNHSRNPEGHDLCSSSCMESHGVNECLQTCAPSREIPSTQTTLYRRVRPADSFSTTNDSSIYLPVACARNGSYVAVDTCQSMAASELFELGREPVASTKVHEETIAFLSGPYQCSLNGLAPGDDDFSTEYAVATSSAQKPSLNRIAWSSMIDTLAATDKKALIRAAESALSQDQIGILPGASVARTSWNRRPTVSPTIPPSAKELQGFSSISRAKVEENRQSEELFMVELAGSLEWQPEPALFMRRKDGTFKLVFAAADWFVVEGFIDLNQDGKKEVLLRSVGGRFGGKDHMDVVTLDGERVGGALPPQGTSACTMK